MLRIDRLKAANAHLKNRAFLASEFELKQLESSSANDLAKVFRRPALGALLHSWFCPFQRRIPEIAQNFPITEWRELRQNSI